MKFSERLVMMESRQTQQAHRIDAINTQVATISSLLKETIVVQQLLYQKGLITRKEVKDELARQEKAIADRVEEARKQAELQSEDGGTDEGCSGDGESGVLPDESTGGDLPRPRLWTPGGYV